MLGNGRARTGSPDVAPRKSAGGVRVLAVAAILGVVGIFVAVAFLTGTVRFGSKSGNLAGAVIDPPFPAPDFQLQDQFDQPIRLSSQRGKVVVLTFLYTNCPDACPIITERIHQAYGQLGPDSSRVAVIAVTVDPAHDTVAQVRSYSTSKDMLDKWHFLVGSESAVAPVWAAYGIEALNLDAQAAQAKASAASASGPTPTPLPAAGLVDHSSPTFLIDRSGKARAILDINFAPSDLVQDVRALLTE
jgi:protein SCO1/2